jgi:hypothetical protein
MSTDLHVDIVGNGSGGVDAAYDSSTDALNVVEVCRLSDVGDPLVDGPIAVGVYNYPGASGFLAYDFDRFSVQGNVDAPAGCTVDIRVFASNDPSATYLTDVTNTALASDGTTQNATIQVLPGTNVNIGFEIRDASYAIYVINVTVAGVDADNVSLWLYRKAQV